MSGREQEPRRHFPAGKMLSANNPRAFFRKSRANGRETMKSFQVTDFNAPLKEVDVPTPQPAGTQVLIKVKAAGVCHSDLHFWEGGYDSALGPRLLRPGERGCRSRA